MKKALIVYGGWPGHDPEGLKEVFTDILTKENKDVNLFGRTPNVANRSVYEVKQLAPR